MEPLEITALLCKIVGIQSEIIKRQSEALAVVDAYDEETDRLMDILAEKERTLNRELGIGDGDEL